MLTVVHNGASGKADLVILDARCLSAGPVATIHLPHFLPAGLHGSWSSQVFGAASEGAPKWKEPLAWRQMD